MTVFFGIDVAKERPDCAAIVHGRLGDEDI
jgi:hypothetical protein